MLSKYWCVFYYLLQNYLIAGFNCHSSVYVGFLIFLDAGRSQAPLRRFQSKIREVWGEAAGTGGDTQS